jgi:hypothetical protein
MLDNLMNMQPVEVPILGYILRGIRAPPDLGVEAKVAAKLMSDARPIEALPKTGLYQRCIDVRQQIVNDFQLNEDQLYVLDKCVSWIAPSPSDGKQPQKPCPITLVHGTFGRYHS